MAHMIFANGFLFCDDMILLLIDYALIVLTYACGFGLCWLFVFIPTFKTGASQSEELHEFTMLSPARGDWEINNLALFLFDSPQLDCCSPRYGDGGRERGRERELVSLQTFEPGATRGLITRILNTHWERRNHPRMAFFKFFTFRALNTILLYPQLDGAGIFTISCRLKQTAGIEHWWYNGGIGCSKHISWIYWSIFETRLQHTGCETRGPEGCGISDDGTLWSFPGGWRRWHQHGSTELHLRCSGT